jgi:proline-specific peptidase
VNVDIDGTSIFYHPVGPESNYPLILLHGGPGLDHTELHPWLDPLADTFRLIYVDQRGQGRSQRVDPASLSLERFAEDVTMLAARMGLAEYALLGHSYGAFVTLTHAVDERSASHYIISGGTASMSKSMDEVDANLASLEPAALREQVTQSWAREAHVSTEEETAQLLEDQMPFHFKTADSDVFRSYIEHSRANQVTSSEVLSYFAANEYHLELEDRLGEINRPTLVMTGEYDRTTTPRASREMAAGIPGSEVVIIPDAGHMTQVEQPQAFCNAVRTFFRSHRDH